MLLERDADLRRIDASLTAAADGRGCVVVVLGRAGIGKTRVMDAARTRARAAGFAVVSARGGQLERGFAYGVVRQLFEPVLAGEGGVERASLMQGAAALAAAALAADLGDAPAPAGVEGEHLRFRVTHGLYWLTANLAARGPLAVCVDDVQWADEPSLRWLAYLAPRLDDLPVVLVVACRTPWEAEGPLGQLIGGSECPSVELGALSEDAVATLVRVRGGGPASPAFCAACHRATGGNPFLVAEVLRAVAAEGLCTDDAGAARVPELGGQAVAPAVRARLQGLPDGAVRLAEAVAVLGTDVEPRRAAALAGRSVAEAGDDADALAAADVLRPGRPLEFVHPVIREAVNAGLPAGARAARHAAAARLLHADHAPAEVVAEHLLHADPAHDPLAVAVLRSAAAGATQQGAPEAAVRYLSRALAEPPQPADRPRVLLELGSAELQSGDTTRAIVHLRAAAAALADPAGRADAACALGEALLVLERYADAIDVFSAARAQLGPDAGPEALRLEAHLAFSGWLEQATAPATIERMRRGPVPAGTTPAERLLLGRLAQQRVIDGAHVDEVAALAERAISPGAVLSSELTSRAPNPIGLALMWAERFDLAGDLFTRVLAEAREGGDRRAAQMALCFRAHAAYRRGDVAEAEADAEEALALASAGGRGLGFPVTRAAVALARVERGDAAGADAVLAEAVPDGATPASGYWGWMLFLHARALVRRTLGRHADALADLQSCAGRLAAWGPAGPAFIPWRSDAALLHAALGDRDRAAQLAAQELALARAFGAPRATGVALRAAGLVAGGTEGTALLAEAVETLRGSGARLELARALADLGAALRRSGSRQAAREPLREALDLAHRCGARALAAVAREELLATGARPRRPRVTGLDSLTASERRVAAMAAAGLANRDIAQTLFVTLRTVETHLSRAYLKLGIRSRAELPGALSPREE